MCGWAVCPVMDLQPVRAVLLFFTAGKGSSIRCDSDQERLTKGGGLRECTELKAAGFLSGS